MVNSIFFLVVIFSNHHLTQYIRCYLTLISLISNDIRILTVCHPFVVFSGLAAYLVCPRLGKEI
jgi:hypothetical protein